MVHVTLVATSLDSSSKSQHLARHAAGLFAERGIPHTLLDLRDSPELARPLELATHIIFAVPIYNFDVNAAAKQVIEDHGGALEGKTVGFLCQAGGQRSYMSVMSFANALMLDFRCWIVPRFVYATGNDFDEGQLGETVRGRIEELVETLLKGN
ncbi:MAG: NAD(P)H-dependent oxidoreductase [Armatimonadetes bacterium]|jgi:NAD(P)H-dependent FMN reductase|nr:NAD(P)H-dependent oxidoreductase [Armatimonadota bacterium]